MATTAPGAAAGTRAHTPIPDPRNDDAAGASRGTKGQSRAPGGGDADRQAQFTAADDAGDTLRIAYVRHKSAPVHAVELLTWPALGAKLSAPQVGEKDGPGWLPAAIGPGPRLGERVESVTALVLDIEAKTQADPETHIKTVIGPEPPTPCDCATEIGLWGWSACVHTSHSHLDPDILPTDQVHPRYRLVLRLSRSLTGAEVRRLGLHVLALLGLGDCADLGCLEPARLFYLPRCPAERLNLFEHYVIEGEPLDVDTLLAEAQRETAAAKERPTHPPRTGNVIGAFNAAHDIGVLLEGRGYIRKGRSRWLHPESTTGAPGVRLLPGADQPRVYSSHGPDPLNNGHAHDAFSVYALLVHGGDQRAAVKAAAEALGMVQGSRTKATSSISDGGGTAGQGTKDAGGARPVIQWAPARLPQCVDEAEDALIASGEQIYRRGATLVRPARGAVDTLGTVRRSAGTLSLIPVEPHHLVERLTLAADWLKLDGRSEDWKPTCCPMDVAKTYLARAGHWRVPTLRAVVQHPIVTLDGRVISVGGYDSDTGILVDIQGAWAVSDAPSWNDAVAALGRLKHLFRYFPWATDTDWAVAASALLSALARPVLDAVPGHGVDAPEAGSGKSLLIDAVSIAATGTKAPVMDWGHDPIEAGKRLDGMLLSGDAIISIDNIDSPLEGAALCQTLTQTSRRIRPLGGSAMTTVPMTAFVTATGNNLVLRGDVTRRMLVCRIDAKTDKPELRVITQDLMAECFERRKEIVADILTVMIAHTRAGRPSVKLRPLGSYGDWSRMVRDALVWCGLPDPVDAMQSTRRGDPARAALGAVLNAWRAAFVGASKTAAEAVAGAMYDTALRDALALVAERKGVLSSSALGYWLRSHRDRRSGDLVLWGDEGNAGVVRWTVVSSQDKPQSSNDTDKSSKGPAQDRPVQGDDEAGIEGITGMPKSNAANCQKGQSKSGDSSLGAICGFPLSLASQPAATTAEEDDLV